MAFSVVGLCQVKVPVTDLARSVRWYLDLLGHALVREFVEDDIVVGAVLASPSGGFVISLRLRDRIPGNPAMPGFDLFSLRVAGLEDLHAVARRCDELGISHGELADRGPDGHHLDVADPDRTNIRFLTPGVPDSPTFAGVIFADGQPPSFYTTPRLISSGT